MHVALIANSAWLDEELPSFQQLVVGLIGEHVRVAQVVPQYLAEDEASVFGEQIYWQESRWELLNRLQLRRLEGRLREVGVDLLHVLDGRLWVGAAQLARAMDVPAVFNANSHLDIRNVDAVIRTLNVDRITFTATTEPIAAAIADRVEQSASVQTIAPGVHQGEAVRRREPGDAVCVVVSGDGRLDARYASLLEGLAQVVTDTRRAQFFFDGQGSDQQAIWRETSRLGMLANISMVPRRLGHRELLVRADMLIQPQALGLSRGLTLQAMAHAVPVVAQADPWLDYLIDGTTARVLDAPDAETWAAELCRYIDNPTAARSLGESAQQWVKEHRLASAQIERTLELYHQIAGSAAVPFPGGA